MSKPFILIDASMTLHGVRFDMDGGQWDRFNKNPVMLYMHVRGVVIGKWKGLRLENNAWIADPIFDVDDPEAAKIAGKVEREFLNAASIQVHVIEAVEIAGETVITKWEPFEASICDAGSNANALQFCTNEGEAVKDTESYIKTLKLSIMSKETKTGTELAETITKEVLPKTIALAVGLGEAATTEDVNAKIVAIVAENASLKLAVETSLKTRGKDLVDAAFAAKKISDSDKDHYLKLAALDFDTTKAILDKIEAPTNLAQFATGDGKRPSSKEDKEEYDEYFKAGTVLELKASDPNKFKRLFKAYYGTEPED